jgi:hypothetical protein
MIHHNQTDQTSHRPGALCKNLADLSQSELTTSKAIYALIRGTLHKSRVFLATIALA